MNIEQIQERINDINAEIARATEAGDTDALASAGLNLKVCREQLEVELTRTRANQPVPAPAAAAIRRISDTEGLIESVQRAAGGVFGSADVPGVDVLRSAADFWTGAGTGDNNIVIPEYDSVIVDRLRPELSFLDLATIIPTESDSVFWDEVTGFVSAAGVVPRRNGSDFGAYQQSQLTTTRRNAVLAKVGHYVRTAKDSLRDRPEIEAILNTELPHAVRQEIERQLLADSDTVGGLPSLAVVGEGRAQLVTYALGTGENADRTTAFNAIRAIRRGKTAARRVLMQSAWAAVSPTADEYFELATDNNGQFYAGNPFATQSADQVWRQRRVVVDALEATVSDENPLGKIVVGSSATWDLRTRSGIEVETSDNVDGDFLKDAVAIKAGQRVALRNKRPEGIVVIAPTGVYDGS